MTKTYECIYSLWKESGKSLILQVSQGGEYGCLCLCGCVRQSKRKEREKKTVDHYVFSSGDLPLRNCLLNKVSISVQGVFLPGLFFFWDQQPGSPQNITMLFHILLLILLWCKMSASVGWRRLDPCLANINSEIFIMREGYLADPGSFWKSLFKTQLTFDLELFVIL